MLQLIVPPACRTIDIEDTHQTLTAIPFKVGVNNSLKLFAIVIVSIHEKICNGKYFEELFTLVLNGIVVSGWYVSYVPVVHHAG